LLFEALLSIPEDDVDGELIDLFSVCWYI
jgi:hypothetical protein